jgi:hypothetical protein
METASATISENRNATGAEFLLRFFAGTKHEIELRAIDKRGTVSQTFGRAKNGLALHIAERVRRGENVYFGCCTREGKRGAKRNCREAVALWADLDFKSIPQEEAIGRIEAFPTRPSIIVSSGGGLHLYWLLTAPVEAHDAGFEDQGHGVDKQAARIESILKGIGTALGGDPAVAELAHVLRVPGTRNFKPEYGTPRDVEIIGEDWDARYEFSEFERYATAKAEREAEPAAQHGKKIPAGMRYGALISEIGRLWQRGSYSRELVVDAGIKWARENFDLEGEAFDEQMVRREINHLIESYSPGNGTAAEVAKGATRPLRFRTAKEVAAEVDERTEFYAEPICAAESITEMVAPPKKGKTTLLLAMIRSILEGTPFLGKRTAYAPVMVLTEQLDRSLRPQLGQASLLGRDDLTIFSRHLSIGLTWPAIVRETLAECEKRGCKILIVDTLPPFAGLRGDDENKSGSAFDALNPLLEAAASGLAVVVVRHERKAGGEVGESGRGSTAFTGFVDTVVQLRRPRGRHAPGVRELNFLSRFPEIPETLMIEYLDNQFIPRGTRTALRAAEAADTLLANAPEGESHAKTLKELIGDAPVKKTTAERAVSYLCREGRLQKTRRRHKGRDRDAYYKGTPEPLFSQPQNGS